MGELKTSIVIEAEDRFSVRAKQIGAVSKKLGKAVEEVGGKLREMGKRDRTIAVFRKLESRLGKTGGELGKARGRASELGRQLKEAGIPTKALERAALKLSAAQKKSAGEADAAQAAVAKASAAHRRQKSGLDQLGAQLRGAGIDTRKLGDAQKGLARDMDAATRKMDRYRSRAEQITRMQGKLDRFTRNAAQLSLISGEGSRLLSGAMRAAAGPLHRLRDFESARGEVATLFTDAAGAVDQQSVDAVADGARSAARRTVGLETADYLRAAYLTKSGIAGLAAQGVVDMTDLAALTARATVADTMQIADLFKSVCTRVKEPLYADLTTREFGVVFSAQLAQAVQQFATDGAKMSQAIASAGNDMTLAGVGLSEQMAVLGMLQGSEEAGVAGTAMLALSNAAAKAQQRFDEAGQSIELLDEANNMRALPDLLDELQRAYGERIDSAEKLEIQEAFGREEAVRFFSALWGRGDALRAAAVKQEKAVERALDGANIAVRMAAARDANTTARMELLRKRWDDLMLRIGERMIPVVEFFVDKMEWAVAQLEALIAAWPKSTTVAVAAAGLGTAIAAAGVGIAVAVRTIQTAASGFSYALDFLRFKILRMPPGGGDGGGKSKSAAGKSGTIRRLSDKIKGFAARGGRGGRIAGATARIGQAVTGNRLGGASPAAAPGVLPAAWARAAWPARVSPRR